MPGNWPANSGQSDDLYNYIYIYYIYCGILGSQKSKTTANGEPST